MAVPPEAICRESSKAQSIADEDSIQVRDVLSKADGSSKFMRLVPQFRINKVSLAAGNDDHLSMIRMVDDTIITA